MADDLHLPDELRRFPFRGSEAIAKGLITPGRLRGRCWRRVFHDVYVWRGLTLDTLTRARAAVLAAPKGCVISGRSAAWLHQVDLLHSPDEDIEITLPRGVPMGPRDGLAIHRALLPEEDIALIDDLRATSAYRTAFDLIRRRKPEDQRQLVEAVVDLDAIAHRYHRDFADLDPFLSYALAHRRWRGVRLIPQVVDLAAPGAESPMESRLRMLLVLNGLPRPVVQHPVPVHGTVYRIDLAYPNARLAIEYDGVASHQGRWAADVARQNELEGLGWRFLRYTSNVYHRTPEKIIAQVRAALIRRS